MPKRTAEEAAKTRQAIVDAARAMFAEKGFVGSQTLQIARAAGVSEGAFFHHFKDKATLFSEIVGNLQMELAGVVIANTRMDQAPLDIFLDGVRASLEHTSNPVYLRIVMLEAPAVLGTTAWRDQDAKVSLAMIRPNLCRIAGVSRLDDEVAMPIALSVFGLINETLFALHRGDKGVTIDSVMKQFRLMLTAWRDSLVQDRRDSMRGSVSEATA
jgi:AcrR family transcriptional regulator